MAATPEPRAKGPGRTIPILALLTNILIAGLLIGLLTVGLSINKKLTKLSESYYSTYNGGFNVNLVSTSTDALVDVNIVGGGSSGSSSSFGTPSNPFYVDFDASQLS
ncbi:hypothetical protein IMZ48_05430 [Candidatus Bathyarchaeota archaeon]|nr:hypothetical protein [Candidatus Bathyarchaeota archaeon]